MGRTARGGGDSSDGSDGPDGAVGTVDAPWVRSRYGCGFSHVPALAVLATPLGSIYAVLDTSLDAALSVPLARSRLVLTPRPCVTSKGNSGHVRSLTRNTVVPLRSTASLASPRSAKHRCVASLATSVAPLDEAPRLNAPSRYADQ
jgi:hypothetical protein